MAGRLTRFMPLLLLLFMVIMAGCSSTGNGGNASAESGSASPAAAESASPEASGSAGKTVYPLTIKNYTNSGEGAWAEKEQTFEKAPEKVVANTQGAAELLIQLGLTDKIVGVAAVYGEVDPEVAEEFAKIPVLTTEYASKELVVGASPDFVLGRADLFADADWGVGTVDALNGLGIHTYLQNTSIVGATVDSLYQDIEQLGQIFDVQERAAEYIAELKARAQALQDKAGSEAKTFAYVSDGGDGNIAVYSGYVDTYMGDVLSLLGLKNSFGDINADISLEQLIAEDPDMMLISDYTGGPDPQVTINGFYENPALQGLKAIQNKAVYVIDFNQFWGYGYTIFDGAEKLAGEIAAQP